MWNRSMILQSKSVGTLTPLWTLSLGMYILCACVFVCIYVYMDMGAKQVCRDLDATLSIISRVYILCVGLCIYIRVYVFVYVYMCIYLFIETLDATLYFMYLNLCVCVCVYMYTCVCICVCIYVIGTMILCCTLSLGIYIVCVGGCMY